MGSCCCCLPSPTPTPPPERRSPSPPPTPSILSSGSEDEDDKVAPIWSFKDRHGIWQKYGHKGEWGRANIRSAQLEKTYQSNPEAIVECKNNSYNYKIDMGRMIQTNLKTGVERPIKRSGGELVRYSGVSSENAVTITEIDPSKYDIDGFDGGILSIIQDKQISKLKVHKIRYIDNPRLKLKFDRAMLQVENKLGSDGIRLRHLYHCTSESNAFNIAQEGFDPKRYANGKIFGIGSYFTPNFRKAHRYSVIENNHRTLIIADVIIGEHTEGRRGLNNAPHLDNNNKDKGRFDSCTGELGGKEINVVFKKEQMYPKFIVSYTLL